MNARFPGTLAAVLGAALLSANPATADMATLTLSDLSSDETSSNVLDARLTFDVSGSTLTLTVFNDTSGVDSYDLSEIYFNATSDVSSLLLTPVPGWSFSTGVSANGFGTFDFALIDGMGPDPAQIAPGASQAFVFGISGPGTFDALDFTTDFSSIPPGHDPSLAATKFVEGPGDDSAYGAVTVPAPGAATLAIIGVGILGWVKRRRSA